VIMAQYYEGIGRRKESTARVRLTSGSGKFIVNEKEGAVYFPRLGDLDDILRPFGATGQEATKYDVSVLVSGGGTTGHVAPLLSLADCLRRRDPTTKIIALGTAEGLESRLVPAAGYDLQLMPRVPLPRRPTPDPSSRCHRRPPSR
jgi:ribosomal protein S9